MQSNKIMIVDNDKEFLNELEEMFKINGFETLIYSKPNNAIRDAKILKPKVIIFDICLDGKNGFKFANKIKYILKKYNIYTIAITGFCDNTDYKNIMAKSGIIECLTKPIEPKDILEKINQIIENKIEVKK